MTTLFVITTIVAAALAFGLATVNASLRNECEQWRNRYSESTTEIISLRGRLSEFQHPTNRGMTEPIDAEAVIANSSDPIWKLVEECYDLKPVWEARVPGETAKQPHQRYADFATFILNLPESEQNRDGVEDAVYEMETV